MTTNQTHKEEQAIQPQMIGKTADDIALRQPTEVVRVSRAVAIQPFDRTRNWMPLISGLLLSVFEVLITYRQARGSSGQCMGRRQLRRRRRGCALD